MFAESNIEGCRAWAVDCSLAGRLAARFSWPVLLTVLLALGSWSPLLRTAARWEADEAKLAQGPAALSLAQADRANRPCPMATPQEDVERAAIRDLVRQHRRTATEDWRDTLTDAIYNEAIDADMDPLFVASIVAKESSFSAEIVSHAGAVGLMQLRPFVARDVAQRSAIEWNGVDTLHAPEINVRLGILYYKELVDRFDGDHHMALTAYNQGPTRVRRNVRNGTYAGSNYAERILNLYDALKS